MVGEVSDDLGAMRRSQLFAELSDDELGRVASLCTARGFADREEVVREDDKGGDIFVVTDGRASVELTNPVPGGRPHQLALLEAGEHFGELSIIDGSLRSATVRSEGPLEVLVIDRGELTELMETDPRIGFKIMRNVANVLSRRLRGTSMRLRNALLELGS